MLNKINKLYKVGPKKILHKLKSRLIKKRLLVKKIRKLHLVSENELMLQRKKKFKKEIKISLITPLYNTPKKYLEELLNSVQKQTYVNWELCLADGSDDSFQYVKTICEKRARYDSRIIYKKLKRNRGISENTNSCIGLSSGEYIALLDHDDVLHPSALYEVMSKIEEGADFIYTDEMRFKNSIKNSVDIICKPEFGKDDLRSHNYLCHFIVFSRILMKQANIVYDCIYEGSQDYDAVLKLTEKASQICHIPQILYYWRIHQNSVAKNLEAKPYAVEAAKKAIAAQLMRCREKGDVESNLPYETIYRIAYKIEQKPLITIILHGVKRNKIKKNIINVIKENTQYDLLEFIYVGEKPEYTNIYSENDLDCIYCSDVNSAIHISKGEYLIFYNVNLIPIDKMWILEMLMYAQRKDVCSVGGHIFSGNNRTVFAGLSSLHFVCQQFEIQNPGYEAMLTHVRNTDANMMFCMMMSKNIFIKLHGFNDEMSNCKDIDYCLRGKEMGYWNVWTCFAKFEFEESINLVDCMINNDVFLEKWGKKSNNSYNPILQELGFL